MRRISVKSESLIMSNGAARRKQHSGKDATRINTVVGLTAYRREPSRTICRQLDIDPKTVQIAEDLRSTAEQAGLPSEHTEYL
jgi:hypothetical protein